MQITRSSINTMKGPVGWFTGDVYVDAIAVPTEPSRLGAVIVHFAPGARTRWHTHPVGQTVFVTEGVGLCQREGGPIEVIRPGDRVFFEPGENHWHGAAANRFMVHIGMQESDESGNPSPGVLLSATRSTPPLPQPDGPAANPAAGGGRLTRLDSSRRDPAGAFTPDAWSLRG